MKNDIYVLQSGFVSDDAENMDRTGGNESSSIRDALYQKSYAVADNIHYYDKSVDSLYRQRRADNELIKRFEFREEVLVRAYEVFGKKSFLDWVRLQIDQYTVGFLHRQFLMETVRFALTGEPRTTECSQFYRLLLATNASRKTLSSDRHAGQSLKDLVGERDATGFVMSDLLANWTQDVSGFDDLLSTMYVIFGRRQGISSVATQ